MAKMHNCPKCDSDDLEIGDCGYSSFNVGWVICKGCLFKLEISCGCFPKKEILASWKKECHDYPIRQRALKKLTKAEKRVLGLDGKKERRKTQSKS